ncbi:unnamed protein product [Camellia sinensis]
MPIGYSMDTSWVRDGYIEGTPSYRTLMEIHIIYLRVLIYLKLYDEIDGSEN